MDYSKEVWHCELYKLQQQAPSPVVVKCKRNIERRPPQYGEEYHGAIDRDVTERTLLNYCNGAFLIRDSQRNIGAYTLVIRFDRSNKNYVLYYNLELRQHYVGSKYFDNIYDLVQDGLIHMYIESRGADILKQISEAKDCEATPFYRSRFYTIQNKSIRPNDKGEQKVMDVSNKYEKNSQTFTSIVNNHSDSCDSGVFSSMKSVEIGLDKADLSSIDSSVKADDASPRSLSAVQPRCKSLYYSLRNKVIPRSSLISPAKSSTTESTESSKSSDYEPLSDYQSQPSNNTINNKSDKRTSIFNTNLIQRSDSQRSTAIECKDYDFSQLEKSHNFKQHTFVGPQWCDFCAHFMWGLVAQGVQCFDCGFQAHKKCSDKVAADCFPVMKRLKRVFGVELTSLAKMDNRAVPVIFERLIVAVEERDLSFQGIYRISGNIDLIEGVKADLDKDIDSVDLRSDPRLTDLETLTGLVKLFLRQLPIPLITSELYLKLFSILKTESDSSLRLVQFRDTVTMLNSVHFSTLYFFIRHLNTVTKSSSRNCMTSSNLAIVFAPTIINKPKSLDSANMSPGMLISRMQSDFKWDNSIVQELIDNCDYIFSPPGAIINEA